MTFFGVDVTKIHLDEFVPIENISASFDGRRLNVTTEVGTFEIGKIRWNAEIEMGLGLNELAVTARITGKF